MARRVALARAIALDPELVMYDEPFAGLDPISLGTAARLIRQLNDTLGLTSIVVSHDLEETFRIADHVIILANGGIAAQGAPDEVRQSTIRWCTSSSMRCPTGRCTSTTRRCRWRTTSAAPGEGAGELVQARRHRLRRAQQAGRPRASAPGCSCGSAGRRCRAACAASAWCATRSISSATIRWRSSRCRACSSASCSACRATTRCSATAPPRRSACWSR